MNKTWYIVATKEFRSHLRNKIVLPLAVILWILILSALYSGYSHYTEALQTRQSANELFQKELEEQRLNPHAAAHFGTYIFKPLTFASLFDSGLNNFTGTYYRVEAHKQHEVNFANVQDRDASLRFGELTIALVFQVLFPLMILFLCFSTISKEREDDTLKLLLAQDLKPAQLILGKIAGNYALIIMIVAPALLLIMLSHLAVDNVYSLFPRLLAFTLCYSIYFFVITSLMVCISAVSKDSRSSLLGCIGLWICYCLLIPRIAAGIADQSYQLPSRYEFNQNIQRGYFRGLNNDGTYVERAAKFDTVLLQRLKLDSVKQIPPNLRRGLSLQNAEDYNTMVYRFYSDPIEANIRKQQALQDMFGFLDPTVSIRQLSMAFSGTDFLHHLHFHHQAQDYRNAFIKTMNLRMANHLPKKGEGAYKEGVEFFRTIKAFEYKLPSYSWVLASHSLALIALAFWPLFLIVIIKIVSKRIRIS